MGDYYDCKRFYRCSNGWKSSLYCPDGTVYDQSIRTCVNSPTGSCIKFANSPYGVNYNGKLNKDQFKWFFKSILRINGNKSNRLEEKVQLRLNSYTIKVNSLSIRLLY